MSRYLALKRGSHDIHRVTADDIAGGAEPGIVRVDKGRYTVQQCKVRLRTVLGEYRLDPRLGFLNRADFIKNFDMVGIEGRARDIILTTYGVKNIVFIKTLFYQRELNIAFRANTQYGEISLEVPWSTNE